MDTSFPGGFPANIPFLHDLGFTNTPCEPGTSEVVLDPSKRHENSFNVLHGGVVMTMLDVGMAMAARSLKQREQDEGNAQAKAAGLPEPRQFDGYVTIEMKTSFLRPAVGKVRALGKCLHSTATMAFCEADLVDEKNRICAKSSGTFKAVMRRPTPAGLDG